MLKKKIKKKKKKKGKYFSSFFFPALIFFRGGAIIKIYIFKLGIRLHLSRVVTRSQIYNYISCVLGYTS